MVNKNELEKLQEIVEGTPADNRMKYCPYCGKPIKEEQL